MASTTKRAFLGALTVGALLAAPLGAQSAGAAGGPVWKVVPVTDPTNFISPSPATEVDDITVDATGGTFTLALQTRYLTGGAAATGPIPYNASAAQVEAALNAAFRKSAVTVTGGPGGPGGGQPYVVTFSGFADRGLVNEAYNPMKADSSFLTGGAHTATVSVSTLGASPMELIVEADNVGGGSTDGSPITLADQLPPGLIPIAVSGVESYRGETLSCSTAPAVICTSSGRDDPGDTLIMTVKVVVEPGLSASVVNHAAILGGGATIASANDSVPISSTQAGYGVAPESVVGALSTLQAGAHANVTTKFTLNTAGTNAPADDVKDVRFDLPVGFVGNTVGTPRCSIAKVLELLNHPEGCPRDTMVGMARLKIALGVSVFQILTPVFNVAPAPGEPAAFAFNAVLFPVRLDTSVLSESTYGVRVTAPDITEGSPDIMTDLTIWGVPADHSGPGPDGIGFSGINLAPPFGAPNAGETRVPLLTNPTQCASPLTTTMSTDSWSEPGVFKSETVSSGTLSGCDALPFVGNVSMVPDTFQAGVPAGYGFELEVPRFQDTLPDGTSAPDVKRVSVTLPLGTVLSPSIANGLTACRNDAGVDPATRVNEFGLRSLSPASCEPGSQIGTVQLFTPLLAKPLVGRVYLGEPECDPCTPADAQGGRMIHLLVQARGEGSNGIIVKLEGVGSVNQQTGQVTTTFENNPQAPFDDLKLTLAGGPRAALANPRVCGPATTTVDLTPWTSPFAPDIAPTSTFEVTGCPAPQFSPSFTAGSTNNQAGAFSPFTLSFSRIDADGLLSGVQLRMPPGLLGMLSSVKLCEEPQASEGTCGADSLIGHLAVATGPGVEPFNVYGGQVFITGPYRGAPYGLSIVVPAKAGPYTLSGSNGRGGVVVRAAINVDPGTSVLTITSDPFPVELDGIPLQLKSVYVTVDRPGFTFNPTNCAKLQLAGTLSSTEGAAAGVSSSYQVTNCGAMAFDPHFTVTTSGRTSRARGASLDAKLLYSAGPPAGQASSQANIAKVKVELPKQLPSKLPTLQKACPDTTFEANPANCSAVSAIGIVKAVTPVLNTPLSGPAYFVSHGGAAFPDLVVILQGSGVRVDLVGNTFISKAGVTSSTFKTVPDVPISSFELYLPQGPSSALAANGNLCKSSLVMPTEFVAQNGAVIHQNIKIGVTGCPKARKAKQARRARRARAAHRHSHRPPPTSSPGQRATR